VLSGPHLEHGLKHRISLGIAKALESTGQLSWCKGLYERLISEAGSKDWEVGAMVETAYAHFLLAADPGSTDSASLERADKLLRKSLETVRTQRPRPEDANILVVGPILHGLALVYARRGKPTFAEGLLANSEGVYEDISNAQLLDAAPYARLLRDSQKFHNDQGRPDRAEKARAKLEELRKRNSESVLEPMRALP